jgi:hypothetical protein
MTDYSNPYGGNPYLQMPTQEAPDWRMVLANLATGIGTGISQGAASGQGWAAGLAPGIAYGNQLTNQQQQNTEQQAMKRWQLGLMAREYDEKSQDRKLKRDQLNLGAAAYVPTGLLAPQPSPTMGPGVTDPAAAAISGIESGGRYDAIGPAANSKGQRAYGKYQVMDFNIPTWTAEVLGKSMTPQEFLASPQAQEAVFKTKFGQFRQQYGSDQDAASVWFSGRPLAGNTAGPDVNGTTVAGYVNKFNRGLHGGQGNTTDVQMAQAGDPRVVPQGDAIAGQGDAPPRVTADVPPTLTLPQTPTLDAATAQRLRTLHFADPARAAAEYKQILETQQQEVKAKYDQGLEVWKHNRGQADKDAWVPLDAKNATMYPGLDPNKAYLRNTKTGDVKQVGGSQVQIDMGGKAVTEIAKQRVQQYEEKIRPAAHAAVSEIESTHRFRQLLDAGAFTGAGAEQKLLVARVADALGVPSDKADNTQALMAAAADRVLASIKSLGANPTDSDRVYLEKAKGGNITFSEGALRKILDIGENQARSTIKKHGEEVGRIRKLEGIKELPDEFFSLSDAPDYGAWSKANPMPGSPAPTQQQMGGNYQPQLDPAKVMQNIAQPKDKAAYDAIPAGTPYLHPDGTFKMKPKAVKR